jgi:hypothetical protein
VTAIVNRRGDIQLRTAYGDPLTALEAGAYTIAVRDESRNNSFHLVGPSLNKRTGLAFRGTATWRVELRDGTFRYRSDRPRSAQQGSFVVLRAR